jgi:putative zinc finger protein
MNPTIQSGMHPDADTLTAFVERLLPPDKREQVLAHMSTCARCREVTYLAQHAAEAESETLAAPASIPAQKMRRGWLGGWRWAWVPASVFAVFVGILTLSHFRHAQTETQMARNSVESNSLQPASPTVSRSQPAFSGHESTAERAIPQGVRRNAPVQRQDGTLKALKEKGVAQKNEVAMGAVAPKIAVQPGLAGRSMHGTVTARPQDTSQGGQASEQLQQSEMQQNLIQQSAQPQQNLFHSRQNPNEPLGDKRVVSGLAPVSASETVTVEAEAKPAAAAPRPSVQLSYAPLSGSNSFELSSAATMQVKKATKIALPSGLPALSVASGAGRTIAVDTSGTLFLSENQGRHWTAVGTQWTGRAVSVRNLQVGTKNAALQALPVVQFELVNDNLQSWTSADGKTWMLENPAAK